MNWAVHQKFYYMEAGMPYIRSAVFISFLSAILTACTVYGEEGSSAPWKKATQYALEATHPLTWSRESRLPLFTNPTSDPGILSDADAERLVDDLDKRGIAVICSWHPDSREESLAQALPIARAQRKQGLSASINATSCMYSFFTGEEKTAHIDAEGKRFFDDSLWRKEMGCPFTIDYRRPIIRERIEYYAEAYRRENIDIGFVWADWEIDGPLDVNMAHETAKRCVRCREHIPGIDDFAIFQKTIREQRSLIQYQVYTEPLISRFPNALVGNYAVYPNDGYRYWLDFFESEDFTPGHEYIADKGARYRVWYNDFPQTGYTYAMPTVYTWYRIYGWYDFDNPDYRWFYNMLLVASNAGKSTPPDVPIVTFVRWHTTDPPKEPDPSVKQMSAGAYQELLWHMLLRGTDTFFVWCGEDEAREEVGLVHEVYAAAQEYGEFLDWGVPVCFDVPSQPGTVVSGLALGDKVLVRRSDFGTNAEPVSMWVGTKEITVSQNPGSCVIIDY